ncbi:MAG: Coenzyme F420 hydrogenase/dehydrogenase, beta subunit C-terminal domain [Bacillota bacterium]
MAGQEHLKNSVIEKGLCSGCGMCVGLCPYIKTIGDRVKVIHACGIEDGICYESCPKTFLDVNRMDSFVFDGSRKDHALGIYRDIYYARAAEGKAPGAQYGGVASRLMAFALDSGIIEGAVMAGGDAREPKPVVAGSGSEIIACAGSKYTAVPTLAAFNQALRNGAGRLGTVGRPCQVQAVRKMQSGCNTGAHGERGNSVKLALGIFCFWSLSPGFYDYLAGKAGGQDILKVDIPLEGLTIATPEGTSTWPVDEIRQYIKDSCNTCIDPTAEWADISVGSTECDPGYNTLMVRTEAGQRLVDEAAEKGILELKTYPEERIPVLRRAALNKKVRVLFGTGRTAPEYLSIDKEYSEEIKKQWEVLRA